MLKSHNKFNVISPRNKYKIALFCINETLHMMRNYTFCEIYLWGPRDPFLPSSEYVLLLSLVGHGESDLGLSPASTTHTKCFISVNTSVTLCKMELKLSTSQSYCLN